MGEEIWEGVIKWVGRHKKGKAQTLLGIEIKTGQNSLHINQ